jgi:hypothetical protein
MSVGTSSGLAALLASVQLFLPLIIYGRWDSWHQENAKLVQTTLNLHRLLLNTTLHSSILNPVRMMLHMMQGQTMVFQTPQPNSKTHIADQLTRYTHWVLLGATAIHPVSSCCQVVYTQAVYRPSLSRLSSRSRASWEPQRCSCQLPQGQTCTGTRQAAVICPGYSQSASTCSTGSPRPHPVKLAPQPGFHAWQCWHAALAGPPSRPAPLHAC